MDDVRTKANNISDQALLLLDDFHSSRSRKKMDLFADLEEHVTNSLQTSKPASSAISSSENANPFTVAARLGRSNYEEQAKSEALLSALKKLRSRPLENKGMPNSGRVLRSR